MKVKKGTSLFLICIMLCSLLSNYALASEGTLSTGETVIFGHYEQDNNSLNGAESIEWIVLSVDKQTNTALVVSKYLLDCQVYNDSTKKTNWNSCFIRNWLNLKFYDSAFTATEKELIISASISNSTDSVFLLNSDQIKKLLAIDVCYATPYAKAHGVYVAKDTGTSSWWVRKDTTSSNGVFVGAHGSIYEKGNKVTVTDNGIRPAILLSLDYQISRTQINSLAEINAEESISIEGYGLLVPTQLQILDKLGRFEKKTYGVKNQSFNLFYDSTMSAQFIVLKIDIMNNTDTKQEYLQNVDVVLECGTRYKLRGWSYQYDYSNEQSKTNYVNEEDSGNQNKNYVIHPSDNFPIAPGDTGHFCFGCTVPNEALDGNEPMRMIITIDGKEIIYSIKE